VARNSRLYMKKPHFIIYIPGLGDRYRFLQVAALWFWAIWGVRVYFAPMHWYEEGTYQQRADQILRQIERLEQVGFAVSLVGSSAGASMALNVAAKAPNLHKVITIAGVNSSELSISPNIRQRSPVFDQSAQAASTSLEKVDPTRIHTIHGVIDNVVTPTYNDIPGASNHRIFTIGHIMTIAACLTILSPWVIRLIKAK
jgi:pimeloyl-ACP methyl ester carboxylesterase